MNWNRKAVVESALALLLAGTLVGCENKEEAKQDPDPEVKNQEEVKETEQATEVIDKDIPTNIMSPGETSVLAAEMFIEKDLLAETGLPDDLELENNGLSFLYVYTYLPKENTSETSTLRLGLPILQHLQKFEDLTGEEAIEYANNFRFDGIEIVDVIDYVLDDNSGWRKVMDAGESLGGTHSTATKPVISKEKIQELNEQNKK